MTFLALILALVAFSAAPLLAQEVAALKKGKVEAKTDEFANTKTVTLSEYSLSETMTFSMTQKISLNSRDSFEASLSTPTVEFKSSDQSFQYGSDSEVNFLIDGKSIRGNIVKGVMSYYTGSKTKDGVTVLGLDTLQKVANGRDVKMKVVETVYVLDKDFKQTIKNFLKELGY